VVLLANVEKIQHSCSMFIKVVSGCGVGFASALL
jgi:hypothetical protein